MREGVPGEVSSFDLRALGAATALAKAHGGEVVALTMGPPAAREGLIECLALGADRAVHLLDPLLAGSDTLATSHALAGASNPCSCCTSSSSPRSPFSWVPCATCCHLNSQRMKAAALTGAISRRSRPRVSR